MTDPTLTELLAYHQPLDDQNFKRQVITKIQASERKRRAVMLVFTLIGLLVSVFYLWSALPDNVMPLLLTPINGVLFSGIGLFLVWLWTDMLADA